MWCKKFAFKSEILTEINTEKLSLVEFMLKMSKIYDIKSENNENRKKTRGSVM